VIGAALCAAVRHAGSVADAASAPLFLPGKIGNLTVIF
jgi:hypothetical protein